MGLHLNPLALGTVHGVVQSITSAASVDEDWGFVWSVELSVQCGEDWREKHYLAGVLLWAVNEGNGIESDVRSDLRRNCP
ncbi:hypothetical protein N7523_004270 [Penicillium sp. IBT 18751x]|nr:hypothetical protein N7523_004270 [Penicillium sp. IBT 18751x]